MKNLPVVAVLLVLALAVGVGLGDGSLRDRAQPRAESDLTPVLSDGTTDRRLEFADRFAGSVAPAVYQGRLSDTAVAIVALPGVTQERVDQLQRHIVLAGGRVTATYPIGPTLLDPSERGLVNTLGLELAGDLRATRLLRDTVPTYVRMGGLLARAVSIPGAAVRPPDAGARTARTSLAAADILDAPRDPAELAPLVLVLLPDGGTADPVDARARAAILSGVVGGLSQRSAGVVVAGDTASGVDGELEALRETEFPQNVATVDSIQTNLGRATAVLALHATLKKNGGAYGESGSDGTAPLG